MDLAKQMLEETRNIYVLWVGAIDNRGLTVNLPVNYAINDSDTGLSPV